jgi:uncharacterized protein
MKKVNRVLPKIKELLEGVYGNRVIEIILYGSLARGTFNQDSDIDIALILKGKVNKAKEINRIYDVIYDLILETDEMISINPISEKEMQNPVWPLYHHIRSEGIKF